jgi:hypothetical protein
MNFIRVAMAAYFGYRLVTGLSTAWLVLSRLGMSWTGSHEWAIGYAVWFGGLVSSCIMLTFNQKLYHNRVSGTL